MPLFISPRPCGPAPGKSCFVCNLREAGNGGDGNAWNSAGRSLSLRRGRHYRKARPRDAPAGSCSLPCLQAAQARRRDEWEKRGDIVLT